MNRAEPLRRRKEKQPVKQRLLTLGAALLVGMLLVGAVHAKLSPAQKRTAQDCLKQFDAREFAARQQAVEKLVAMGPDVLPMVKKSLAKTTDNEVKLRCEMVVKRISEEYDLSIDYHEEKEPDYGMSRVTIDRTNAPLQEVLDALAQQSGNRIVKIIDFAPNKSVTFNVKNMPYWQAMDELCYSQKLIYNMTRGKAPRVFQAKSAAKEFVIYSGPMSFKMTSMSRTHTRSESRRFDVRRKSDKTAVKERRTLTFDVAYRIEDRLPVLKYLHRITRIATPDGVNHARPTTAKEKFDREWNRFPNGAASALIDETAGELKGPLTIEGHVSFQFGLGKKELRLRNIFAGGTPTVKNAEGMSMKLVKALRIKGRPVSVIFEVSHKVRDLTTKSQLRLGPKYGLAIIGPKGKRYWRNARSTSSTRSGKTRITMDFSTLPDLDGEWAIVFTRPTKMVKKTFPFKFENVPLP